MLTVADTAFAIAAVRAEESQREEPLFDDPYAALFRAAGAHAEEGTRRFLELPFFRDGIRLRTRFIDDALADGIAAGIDQVILLGAGFDARGLRAVGDTRGTRDASVFEVDFAEQLDRKRAVLEGAGIAVPAWISYIACDFGSSFEGELARALDARGFDRARPAVVIWEGVTTYIGRAATDRTSRFLAELCAAGTRVVFDVGSRFFGDENIAEHVMASGFSSASAHGGDELWRRYLRGEPPPAASVFQMVIAQR